MIPKSIDPYEPTAAAVTPLTWHQKVAILCQNPYNLEDTMSTMKARIKEAVILKLEPRLEMQMLNLQIEELETQLIALRRKRRALRHQLRTGDAPVKTTRELIDLVFDRKSKPKKKKPVAAKAIEAVVVVEEPPALPPPPAKQEVLVPVSKVMQVTQVTATTTQAQATPPKRTGLLSSLFSSKADDEPVGVPLSPRDKLIHSSQTAKRMSDIEKAVADPESDLGKKVRSKVQSNFGVVTDPFTNRIIKKSIRPQSDDDDELSENAIDNFARKIGADKHYVNGDRKASERMQMEIRRREEQNKKKR